jgi:hypothetical protein
MEATEAAALHKANYIKQGWSTLNLMGRCTTSGVWKEDVLLVYIYMASLNFCLTGHSFISFLWVGTSTSRGVFRFGPLRFVLGIVKINMLTKYWDWQGLAT